MTKDNRDRQTRAHSWARCAKKRLPIIATILALGTGAAHAIDAVSPYNWAGAYIGLTASGGWGHYDTRTSTISDGHLNAAQAGAVNAAGKQTIKAGAFGAGVEGGYNWQTGNLVVGIEADFQAVQLNGAASTGFLRYHGAPAVPPPNAPPVGFAVNSYGYTNWLFTARPRIGFVAPNNWLFYATGGLAITQLQNNFSFIDNNTSFNGVLESGQLNKVIAGYAVGGGIEAPLTSRLSVKADYLHVEFPNTAGAETISNLQLFFPAQVISHSSNLKVDIFHLGLNYHFDNSGNASSGDPLKAWAFKDSPSVFKDWQVQAGTRVWFSSGSIGAPQPLINNGPPGFLESRLTYSGLAATSAEVFGRVDHASGIFVKGNLGAGAITSGRVNNEDFVGLINVKAYSNTLSTNTGDLGYATIDLGYNFFTAPAAKFGVFVGYNYYVQELNTYGCAQLAADTAACSPAIPSNASWSPNENDHINSLRIGLSGAAMLTDRLKVTADAAFVPWATFSGLDNHQYIQLLWQESARNGNGVMLEAMIDYYITNAWSVGVGGRYWAWNFSSGTTAANFLIAPAQNAVYTSAFSTERYGMFLQSSYQFGGPAPSSAKATAPTSSPMDWSGFYVGGHLGGGRSTGQWSDPFGSTVSAFGVLNVAGFGDITRAGGPLGGGQIGANWQTGAWVFGAEADVSVADMRGVNTCFSGIGGMDCQHNDKALGTVTGRAGYAWDRSLAYVKGGGAWAYTSYNLFGNTQANLAPFGGTINSVTWGWTLGTGIEYALTNNWTAFGEYDHIGLPSTTVQFPTVPNVNTARIGVSQSIDLFKLGVNYKFDFHTL